MSNIQKARETATRLHAGQTRKDSSTPYITHPVAVAGILSRYTDDDDTLCAAFLHDTLEDVDGYSYDRLKQDFGSRVADIVKEVSEDKVPGDSRETSKTSWRQRKEGYIGNLQNNSREALMVSCADKIANLTSL